ncbi:MAG: inner membrane CreD family protein, partial [Alphaproteobacteria bacterium]
VQRLSDYGIMFVALTFIMMFLFERGLKQNLYYVQYAVIGLSLCLFFLTLLSLSEHICFGISYVIASLVVIFMISLYLYGALKNKTAAAFAAFILAVIYGVLYLMFSESDYALLIGTGTLLTTMGLVMWQTRGLNAHPEDDE